MRKRIPLKDMGKSILENENVEYTLYGEKHTPTLQDRKGRAFAYALTLAALSDVGAGEDALLFTVREVAAKIKHMCLKETGFLIYGYDTDWVGCDYSGWKKNPFREQKKEVKE